MGVTEPEATFSACFGEAFLAFHPTHYAEMLAEKVSPMQVLHITVPSAVYIGLFTCCHATLGAEV